MSNLFLTISVEGSPEKTEILNQVLADMAEVKVVEHDEESRGLATTGAAVIKWVVEMVGDTKAFGAKLCDVVEKQLAGSTVKLTCPPGITIEVSNASRGQLLEIMNAAMTFMQNMNKPS